MESALDLALRAGQARPVMAAERAVPVEARAPLDVSLVVAARAGDREAFEQLYERYGRMVHGVLLAYVAPIEVEDLVQDVFLQAYRSLAGLRDPAAFGGWLLQIARNRARDHHRASLPKAEVSAEFPEELPGPRDTATEAWAALEAIRRLPDAYRLTLMLRLVEGMTGPEIAERTGMKADSVRVNLHRGMKLLRRKLGLGVAHER